MEQRLIDANALLKELRKSCEYHAENSREFLLLQRDIIIVQEQPTIDAVPVIRCKDCKHSKAYYHGEHSKLGMITYFCTRMLCNVKADDYCSWSERKE